MTNTKKPSTTQPDIISDLQKHLNELEAEQQQAFAELEVRGEKIQKLKTALEGLETASTTTKLSEKAAFHAKKGERPRSKAWTAKMRREASERMKTIWAERLQAKYSDMAQRQARRSAVH